MQRKLEMSNFSKERPSCSRWDDCMVIPDTNSSYLRPKLLTAPEGQKATTASKKKLGGRSLSSDLRYNFLFHFGISYQNYNLVLGLWMWRVEKPFLKANSFLQTLMVRKH